MSVYTKQLSVFNTTIMGNEITSHIILQFFFSLNIFRGEELLDVIKKIILHSFENESMK